MQRSKAHSQNTKDLGHREVLFETFKQIDVSSRIRDQFVKFARLVEGA